MKKELAITKTEIALICLGFVFNIVISFASFVIIPCCYVAAKALDNYYHAIFYKSISFKDYDGFKTFFDSKYNVSNTKYMLTDTSDVVDGTRLYFVSGQDRCRQHGVNCRWTTPHTHYLKCDSDNMLSVSYEYCQLPFSYDTYDKKGIFVKQCSYHLVFNIKDELKHSDSLLWEPCTYARKENLYNYSDDLRCLDYCFSLYSDQIIVATLLIYGIPSSQNVWYDSESAIQLLKQIDTMMDGIKNKFVFVI